MHINMFHDKYAQEDVAHEQLLLILPLCTTARDAVSKHVIRPLLKMTT